MSVQGREITSEDLAKFLQKLKSTNGNVSKACQAAKIARKTAYEHRKKNEEFAALWDEALETTYDAMEEEMYRRAVKGVVEPLIHKGQIVKDDNGKPIMIRKFSDRLLEFALKGNRPEKFRERVDINNNHSGSLEIDLKQKISNTWSDHKDNLPPIDDDASDNRKDSE